MLNDDLTSHQAIVDGDPPDLPKEGFSQVARDFVRGCLHKTPKLRPTYSMLLQHPWLAGLSKPAVITEDEEMTDAPGDVDITNISSRCDLTVPGEPIYDLEVAEWVRSAMERKAAGLIKSSAK